MVDEVVIGLQSMSNFTKGILMRDGILACGGRIPGNGDASAACLPAKGKSSNGPNAKSKPTPRQCAKGGGAIGK